MENSAIFGEVRYIKKNGKESPPFPLSHGKYTIGSAMDANIRLKGQEGSIENIHCILSVNKHGQTTLINKSQAHPTKVNGIEVELSKVLTDNDNFEVVDKTFQFSLTELGKKMQSSASSASSRSVDRRHTIYLGSSVSNSAPKSSKRASLNANPKKVSPYGKKRYSMVLSKKPSVNKTQRRTTTVLPRNNMSFDVNKLNSPDARPYTKNTNLMNTTSKINVPKSLPAVGISKKRLSLCLPDPNVTVSPEARVSTRNILLGNSACDVQLPSRRSNISLTVSSTPILKSAKKTPKSVKRLQKTPLSGFKMSFSVTPTRSSSRTRQTPKKYGDFALQYSFISEASAKSNSSKGNQSQNLDEPDLGDLSLKQNVDEISEISVKKSEKSKRTSALLKITEDFATPVIDKTKTRGSMNRSNRISDDLITFENKIEIQDTSVVHSFNIYSKTPEVTDLQEIADSSLNKEIELSPILSKSRTSRSRSTSLLKNTSIDHSLDDMEEVSDEIKLSLSTFDDDDSKQADLKTSTKLRASSRVSKTKSDTSRHSIRIDHSIHDGNNFNERNSKTNTSLKDYSFINCPVIYGDNAYVQDLSGSSLTEKRKSSRISNTKTDNFVCHEDNGDENISNASLSNEIKEKSRQSRTRPDTSLGQLDFSTIDDGASKKDISNISLNNTKQKRAGSLKTNDTNEKTDTTCLEVMEQSISVIKDDSKRDTSHISLTGNERRSSRISKGKTDSSFEDLLQLNLSTQYGEDQKQSNSRTSNINKTNASLENSIKLDQSTQCDDVGPEQASINASLDSEKRKSLRMSKAKAETSFEDFNSSQRGISPISTASVKRSRSGTSKVDKTNASLENSIKLDQSTQCDDVGPEQASINASLGSEKRKSSRASKAKTEASFENLNQSVQTIDDDDAKADDLGPEQASINDSLGREKRRSSTRVSKAKTEASFEDLNQSVQTIDDDDAKADDLGPEQASINDSLGRKKRRSSTRVSKAKTEASFEDLNQSVQTFDDDDAKADDLGPEQASINESLVSEKRRSSARVSKAKTEASFEDLNQSVQTIDDDDAKADDLGPEQASINDSLGHEKRRSSTRVSKAKTEASFEDLNQSVQTIDDDDAKADDLGPEQASINDSLGSGKRSSTRVSKAKTEASFEDLNQSVQIIDDDDSKANLSRISTASVKQIRSRTSVVKSNASFENSIKLDESARYDHVDPEEGSILINASLSSEKRKSSRVSTAKTGTNDDSIKGDISCISLTDNKQSSLRASKGKIGLEDSLQLDQSPVLTNDSLVSEKRRSSRVSAKTNASLEDLVQSVSSIHDEDDASKNELSPISLAGEKWRNSRTSKAKTDEGSEQDSLISEKRRSSRISKVETDTSLHNLTQTDQSTQYDDDDYEKAIGNNSSLMSVSKNKTNDLPEANTTSDLSSNEKRNISTRFMKSYNTSSKIQLERPDSLVVNLDSDSNVSAYSSVSDKSVFSLTSTPYDKMSGVTLRNNRRVVRHELKAATDQVVTTPENNISLIEISSSKENTPVSKVRKYSSMLKNNLTKESTEETTPERKSADDGTFKTPLTTPALFESLKKSALRSRKRISLTKKSLIIAESEFDNVEENGAETAEEKSIPRGMKRMRDSTGKVKTAKKKKMTGSQSQDYGVPKLLRFPSSDLESENSIEDSEDSVLEEILAHSSDENKELTTKSRNSSVSESEVLDTSNLNDKSKSKTRSVKDESFTELKTLRRSQRSASLQANSTFDNTLKQSVSSKMSPKTQSEIGSATEAGITNVRTRQQRKPNNVDDSNLDISGAPKQSTANVTANLSGVKRILRTPKSPVNDLRDVRGVRKLLQTPKEQQSPNVSGIGGLYQTPLLKNSQNPKDLGNISDVKASAKKASQRLVKTTRQQTEPKNDLTDVAGVKQLLRTPKMQNSPKNDLTNVAGVKKLYRTPTNPKTPKNDLTNVAGVKKLYRTPTNPKTPKNDLSDVRGVREMFKTPRNRKEPKNDLTDVFGLKKLYGTPKQLGSPKNDLSDVSGVKRMYQLEDVAANRKSLNVSGVNELFQASENQSDIENVDLFTKLTHIKALRTYKGKSLSPIKGSSPVYSVNNRRTLGDIPTNSPNVDKWVEDQMRYVTKKQCQQSPADDVAQSSEKDQINDVSADIKTSEEIFEEKTPVRALRNRKKSTKNVITDKDEESVVPKRILRGRNANKKPDHTEEATAVEVPKTRAKRNARKNTTDSQEIVPIKRTRNAKKITVDISPTVQVSNSVKNTEPEEKPKTTGVGKVEPEEKSKTQKRKLKNNVSSEVPETVPELPKTRSKRIALENQNKAQELTPIKRTRRNKKADESLNEECNNEVEPPKPKGRSMRPKRAVKKSDLNDSALSEVQEDLPELPKPRAKRNPAISSGPQEMTPIKRSKRIEKKVHFEGEHDVQDPEKDTVVPEIELKSQKSKLRTRKVSADTDNANAENQALEKENEVNEKENVPQKSSSRSQRTKRGPRAQNVTDEKHEELSDDSKPKSGRNLKKTKGTKIDAELEVVLKPTKTRSRKKQELKLESPVKSGNNLFTEENLGEDPSSVTVTKPETLTREQQPRPKKGKTEQATNTNRVQFVIDDDGVEIKPLPRPRRRKLLNVDDLDHIVDVSAGEAGPSQRQLRRRR